MKRRQFIKAAAATVGAAITPSLAACNAAKRPNLVNTRIVQSLPGDVTRTWVGESFWANRLQDWQLANGRIECLCGEQDLEVRTVALLTRFLEEHHAPGRIRTRVGLVEPGKNGFGGFLLGAGHGELDYRGAALVHARAGTNGGFLAVIDESGELSFRDFSSQDKPLAFERIARSETAGNKPVESNEIILDCHIDPVDDGLFDVRLVAIDAATGDELGFVVRTSVPAHELEGGIALVSSPPSGAPGARWWFADVETGGDKIGEYDERQLGALIGCLHSVNQSVLKLTAQFMPLSAAEQAQARLDYRKEGEPEWTHGPVAEIGDGYVAAFRLEGWDNSSTFDYRVVDPARDAVEQFTGQVMKDPGDARELCIALYSCIIPVSKAVDNTEFRALNTKETMPGRFTPANVLFPHDRMVSYCDSHEPDLYVFCGDQYYETFPTRFGRHTEDAMLDTLYRWYLWYWTFRDSVRSRPSIVLADDHDILQGNVWGNAGDGSELPTEEEGGYKWDKDVIRTIFNIQHGANPDPYDPTPIKYDLPVTYGEFIYGGVSFALVEDRKWKTPPDYESNPLETTGELLGARQEAFLAHWGQTNTELPKICLAASIWGNPQTTGDVEPLLDYDANGYPPDGRTRAVKLVADANALVLVGDQHLGLIAHQGIEDYEDGAVFFAGPAAASFWQRWFEGQGKLENQRDGDPNTGNFVDCFGNKMRVLAVANPNMTQKEFSEGQVDWYVSTADRSIPSEGYGIIRVNQKERTALLECWERETDPATGKQFAGWPYLHRFEK
jgi:alkaline phosphatase D